MSKRNQAQNQQQAEQAPAKTAKQEIEGSETAVIPPFPSLQRSLSPADAHILQRTIGNQALGRLMTQGKTAVVPTSSQKIDTEKTALKIHAQPKAPSHNPAANQGQDPFFRLQRKPYFVGQPNTPVFELDEVAKIAGYTRIGSLKLNQEIDAEENAEYTAIDATNPEYKKVNTPKIGALGGVVHQNTLREDKKQRSGAWDVLETGGDALSKGASIYDLEAGSLDRGTLKADPGGTGWRTDIQGNTETKAWQEKHSAEVVSGGYETVANIISIASTLRNWKKRNNAERFSDVVDVTGKVLSTGAAVTKMVDSGGKLDKDHRSGLGNEITVGGGGKSSASEGGSYQTNQSDLAGKVTGNIADFGGLLVDVKDIFFKGKALWKTWKDRRDKQTASRGDVARAAIGLGMTVLTTIKDIVSTARNLLFTLENAWSTGLSATIPGLGIAIGGLQIIVSMWNVIKANKHRDKMRGLKKNWKVELRNKLGIPDTDELDNKVIAQRKAEIIKNLNANGITVGGRKNLLEKLGLIQEYELQKELQTINRKRIDRQVLHISTALANIGGDIATLTGYGASAGIALKAAASATELGAKGLRTVKQFGRDRASKEGAWDVTQKVFDKEKNSKAKQQNRERFANMIYDMVITLSEDVQSKGDPVNDANYPQFKRIRDYIRAVGLSWKVWVNKTTADPGEGHTLLLRGLAERE